MINRDMADQLFQRRYDQGKRVSIRVRKTTITVIHVRHANTAVNVPSKNIRIKRAPYRRFIFMQLAPIPMVDYAGRDVSRA